MYVKRQKKNYLPTMEHSLLGYTYTWSDLVGNIGVALLLSTFYANVQGTLSSQGFWYNFNNLLAALLLSINLYYKPNISSIIIEVFWISISLYGLIKWYRNEKIYNTND